MIVYDFGPSLAFTFAGSSKKRFGQFSNLAFN